MTRSALGVKPTASLLDEPPSSKPVPPDDLWDQLDAAIAEIDIPASRPPGSFTSAEFREKRKLSEDCAARQILKLLRAGKIVKRGAGNKTYYELVKA